MRLRNLFLLCLCLGACKPSGDSDPTTVGIPATGVKDQGETGFCWSYSTNALLESWALLNKGLRVSLSEEATAFYHLATQLQKAALRIKDPKELTPKNCGCNLIDTNHLNVALELLAQYGAIPTAAWNVKFTKGGLEVETLLPKLTARFIAFAKSRPKGAPPLSLDEIVKNVMVGPGLFPSAPPLEISTAQGKVSAKDYPKKVLGFDVGSFQEMRGASEADFDRIISAIKRSLARGYAVPLAVPVLKGMGVNDMEVTGDASSTFVYAGHAVTVTDFVNVSGYPGAMSAQEIRTELEKPSGSLAYVVAKDSFGTARSSRLADAGYALIDKAYLQESIRRGYVGILVPKDIAANPKGAESVNRKIAAEDGDGSVTDVYAREIKLGTDLKILSGFPDGSFRPKAFLTREQAVVFVLRALALAKKISTQAESPTAPFADVDAKRWSSSWLAWAKQKKIVAPDAKGKWAPEKIATREFVVEVARKAAEVGRGKPIPASTSGDAFSDIEGTPLRETISSMAAYCGVATSFQEKFSSVGRPFAPTEFSFRNFGAAAAVRLYECVKSGR